MATNLETGAALIRSYARNFPDAPGVYRMLAEDGAVLYVGKARSLKKRVASYANTAKHPRRLLRMVSETKSMEIVRTHTEVEALLLESNMIKKLRPRYNVDLKDDKSFPYILVPGDHDYPRIQKHRGPRKTKGEYYGPFASAGAVNRTIETLQRAFKLRNCTDGFFAARKRPCLQYHIKRCTAPCVDYISKADYAAQVGEAQAFLTGESRAVQQLYAEKMQAYSEAMDFERAAEYRDRLRALQAIQSQQDINVEGVKNADIIGLVRKDGRACIQIFFFRAGQNYGNRPYFPKVDEDQPDDEIMAEFIGQFYENKPVPPVVMTSHMPAEAALLTEALQLREGTGRKVEITAPQRGPRRRVMDFVLRNAKDALERQIIQKSGEAALLAKLCETFGLGAPPERIEVYDNSHISGTNMVGAMIVAGPDGFRKTAYRKFNIKTAEAADDYGMMREVMQRRFARMGKGDEDASAETPALVLIDGGLGQFNTVKETLEEMGLWGAFPVVSIAKGPDRNAGREQFFMDGRAPFQLPINDPVLHYLQRLRDEAHRFAIGAHRTRRKMDISRSPLDEIAGIGAARKKALLLHFGSAKAVARAGLSDLTQVEGISKAVAEKIYAHFHER